jgi:BASS family bile acid:Na+ symporter
MTTARLIQILTGAALFALLLAVGLRLTWSEVITSVRRCRFAGILTVNFLLIPALTVVAVSILSLPAPIALGMILLASAPFAPMVPIFARLARADLALAAGLTALFPILSAGLTPVVCLLCFHPTSAAGKLHYNFWAIVCLMTATVTIPLAAGIALRRWNQRWRAKFCARWKSFRKSLVRWRWRSWW